MIENNKYSGYSDEELLENANNALDMLLASEQGNFFFQTTNFDAASFACKLIPLNRELLKRGYGVIKFPEKDYNTVIESMSGDTYEYTVTDFKLFVGRTHSLEKTKPSWYKMVPKEKSIPELTSANKVLGK